MDHGPCQFNRSSKCIKRFSKQHQNSKFSCNPAASFFDFDLQALFQKVQRKVTLTSCFVVQPDDANHSTFCSSKSISKHVSLRDQQIWNGQDITFHLSPLYKDIWKGRLTVRLCEKVHNGAEMGVMVEAMVSTFRADHAKEMSTQGHPFCVE